MEQKSKIVPKNTSEFVQNWLTEIPPMKIITFTVHTKYRRLALFFLKAHHITLLGFHWKTNNILQTVMSYEISITGFDDWYLTLSNSINKMAFDFPSHLSCPPNYLTICVSPGLKLSLDYISGLNFTSVQKITFIHISI